MNQQSGWEEKGRTSLVFFTNLRVVVDRVVVVNRVDLLPVGGAFKGTSFSTRFWPLFVWRKTQKKPSRLCVCVCVERK